MTDHDEPVAEPAPGEEEQGSVRFPELAELEEKIQRRLRSNQRFLERFMDEDYDDLDDDDPPVGSEDENPDQLEEL